MISYQRAGVLAPLLTGLLKAGQLRRQSSIGDPQKTHLPFHSFKKGSHQTVLQPSIQINHRIDNRAVSSEVKYLVAHVN